MTALEVRGLRIAFDGQVVVDGVSFSVEPGQCVAIVGESGAGKTLTARAMLGLTPAHAGVHAELLEVAGTDARRLDERSWRRLRGDTIALVSQDALVSLDPLQRIRSEIAEPLRLHERELRGAALHARVRTLLERVWMPDAERRAEQYPHELSGGLRQRALIASSRMSRRRRWMQPSRRVCSTCCARSRIPEQRCCSSATTSPPCAASPIGSS